MRQIHLFTPEDDKVIVEVMKQNTQNLTEGFNIAGKLLKRKPKAIASRYYNNIRKQHNIFLQGNNDVMVLNSKNTKVQKDVTLPEIMNMVINMKPEFQEVIKHYLNTL